MLSRRLFLALTLSAAITSAPLPAPAQGPDPAAIVKSIYGKRDPYGAATSLQMRAPRFVALARRGVEAPRRLTAERERAGAGLRHRQQLERPRGRPRRSEGRTSGPKARDGGGQAVRQISHGRAPGVG